MADDNLKRIGAPHKLSNANRIRCRVCQSWTKNPTQVCNECSGLVVGKWADTDRTRILFKEILRPENEWEYILPRRP
jgi:hypothetical protein